MAAAKKKFTKRLSVRLGAVFTVVALGAIAIAQGQLPGQKPVVEKKQAPDKPTETDQGSNLNPIPMPEGVAAEGPSSPETDADLHQGFAAFPEFPTAPASHEESTVRVNPASDAMVVRGNDEGETPPSTEMSDLSAPSFDFNPNALPEVPAGPPANSFAEPPEELNRGLQDATRSAIADSEPPASVYGASPTDFDAPSSLTQESVYGGSSAALAAPVAVAADAASQTQLATPQPTSQQPTLGAASPEGEPEDRFDTPAAGGGFAVSIGDTPTDSIESQAAPQTLRTPTMPVVSDAAQQAGFEGDGAPGAETLDGRQAPALTVEKIAPQEIQVGKETSFEVRIRNVGQVAAHDLIVLDRVPRGTRFVNATPQANEAPDGQLMWQLGTLEPGEETIVSLIVLPVSEGEIGSVAQVLFQTHASVRTICTKPELAVQHTGPQKVLIGESVLLDITLSNPGTGAATGVVLEEDIPEGLAHAAGQELEYEVGTLKPGESRRLQLTLKADKAGLIENSLIVRGDGNLIAHDMITLEVIAPSLEVSLNGPKLRYLEREAVYEVGVANPGTAAAREVELVTYLPKGMKFVNADHKGKYEPQNHAVYWSLEELPPRQSGVAKLTLLPLETGEQKLSVEGRAELGLQHSSEKLIQVDSLAELQFTIADEHDPIEIGSETTYVVTLTNRGSSAATNIRILVGMPPELKPIGGDGPTKVVIEGTQLSIESLARLGPGEQAQYKLRVRGLAPGPQRFQLQLVSDETPVPVTKEEITRVYADQ